MKLSITIFGHDFYNHDIGAYIKGTPLKMKRKLKKELAKARRKDGKVVLAEYCKD
jgi:hypothetical protein